MDKFRPLDLQFGIAHDCLRSLIYAGHIANTKDKADAWHSLGDMCFADGLMSWAMIFGSRSQDTHWRCFNKTFPPPASSALLPFSEQAIYAVTGLDTNGWVEYHKQIKDFRDNRLAHLVNLDDKFSIPNIQPAYSCMFVYREWLLHLAQAFKERGDRINPTQEGAANVADTFRSQVVELLPASA